MHGWKTASLGDVCVIEKTKFKDGELPYVGMEDIVSGTGKFVGSREPKKVGSSTFQFTPNHLLYGRLRPYLNKVLLPDFEGHCSSEIFPLLPKAELDKSFLFYWITSEQVVKEINRTCTGARMPRANVNEVLKFDIPIPPIEEQKRIVAILDEAFAGIDTAIANTEKNLANARELFLSKKNHLFQVIEKTAQLKPLPTVCEEIFAGGDAPKGNYSKIETDKFKIPIYANAVKDAGLYGYTDFARALKPSITVAARGSGTGHIELRREPFLPIVRLIVLTPNEEELTLEYLMHAIQNLDILRSGSAIPQLTVPMIKEYSIPVPTIIEQNQIVEKLEELSGKIVELEFIYQLKLNSLTELKQSLLQKAFSGELTAEGDKLMDEAVA